MKILKLFIVPMACLPLAPSGTAYGQAVPDIQNSITQDSQINELIRDQDRIGVRPEKDENEIDGEAGIYVLTLNEIFYVGALAGFGYSGNPLRTSDDVGGSFSTNITATAGVQTRLGDTIDFGLNTSLSGVEYFKNMAPSSRSANSAVSFGTALGNTPLYLGVNAFGGFNYDGSFNNSTSFYGSSVSLSAGFLLGNKTYFRPGISFTRQWSSIKENNNKSLGLMINVTHAIAPKLNIGLSSRITRTQFDNFFEDVTFVERKDWQYGGRVSATYVHNENLTVSVSTGYEKRDSTFFLSSYDSFESSMLLSAHLTF